MKKHDGFTLVELMVALVLVVIVSGVMYALYRAQNQTTVVQGHVADIQQILRYSADFLSRDIRMAGYDPEGTGEYRIEEAKATSMIFTADICEDGGSPANDTDCQEIYQFELYGDDDDKIRRKAVLDPDATSGSAFAEKIEEFEFCYSNGTDPCKLNPDSGELDAIREVIVSILVRSDREDSKYRFDKSKMNFRSGSNVQWPLTAVDDRYHRRMIVKRIKLRNMGL